MDKTRTANTSQIGSAPVQPAALDARAGKSAATATRNDWQRVGFSIGYRSVNLIKGLVMMFGGAAIVVSQLAWLIVEPACYALRAAWRSPRRN